MKIKKVKNFSNNIVYGVLYRIISLLFPFIIRTLMINYFSTEYLGLSSLFTSILQALNLAELGLGSTLVFNMYEPIANNDYQKLSKYMNFYKKCYRGIGLFVLVAGLLLMPFLDIFISGDYPADVNIYIVYFIYLINTVISYMLFSYKNAIALAYQRTDIENKALIISNFVMYIMQIIVIVKIHNYYLYVFFFPVFTILKNMIISHSVDKNFPAVSTEGDLSTKEKKKLLDNIKDLFGHQICFTIINSADNILLSSYLGLKELTIYNNYYYIFSAIVNIITIFFSSIQAGLGNDLIINNEEAIYSNFKRFRLFVYIIIEISSMCLVFLYQPFMRVWMGEKMMMTSCSVLLFSLGFYITQTRKVITTYKNASGQWKADFWKPYIVIFVDVIVDIFLIKKIGSIGAMISTIISMGLIAIPWETKVLFKNVFKREMKEHILFLIKYIIITIINFCIIYLVFLFFKVPNPIINIGIRLILIVVISISINILFNYNTKELSWGFERIKLLIKNRV